VGRALALIHRNIGLSWLAEALAKEVALLRSKFMDRFTTLVGTPPIRYLTVWRLQTAKLNLRKRRTPIAKLAHSVGYDPKRRLVLPTRSLQSWQKAGTCSDPVKRLWKRWSDRAQTHNIFFIFTTDRFAQEVFALNDEY
jgi:AraC-like DNA-binding protein